MAKFIAISPVEVESVMFAIPNITCSVCKKNFTIFCRHIKEIVTFFFINIVLKKKSHIYVKLNVVFEFRTILSKIGLFCIKKICLCRKFYREILVARDCQFGNICPRKIQHQCLAECATYRDRNVTFQDTEDLRR